MIAWQEIDTVLLDMDGTLLDLNFDNHFWHEFVPTRFAQLHQLTFEQAKQQLLPRFKAMEGKLEWYCLDYWSAELELDIAGLKQEVAGLIAVHPHVIEFLEAVRNTGKTLWLVTNAHRDSLNLKLEKTCLQVFFDEIISSHDLGMAKEQAGFWTALQNNYVFEKRRTLLADDNSQVLRAAQAYGIAYLVAVIKPDSKSPVKPLTEFVGIEDFRALMPGL